MIPSALPADAAATAVPILAAVRAGNRMLLPAAAMHSPSLTRTLSVRRRPRRCVRPRRPRLHLPPRPSAPPRSLHSSPAAVRARAAAAMNARHARTVSLPPRTRTRSRAAAQTTAPAAVRTPPAAPSPQRPAHPKRSPAAAAVRDEDPGLVLISRRPPQQKFTNFEEYMNAHGGATAPIEDHSDEV